MKCKACNGTLTDGEQTLDPRTDELNDICNECLAAGMSEKELDLSKLNQAITLEETYEQGDAKDE